ncbi:Bug family tripartite tricarboxylate transporter substrate binding protein [Roseomonas sp. WA12]
MRRPSRRALLGALAPVAPGLPHPARAQDGWPSARPIRLVVPYSPGSAPDNVGRLYAEGMRARLGQSIVAENRSGGAGMIGTEAGARAAPDGYTLLVSINGPISVNRHLYDRMNYDAERDLCPVAMLAISPLVMVVSPRLGPDLSAFLSAARAQSGLSYASTGIGSASHLLFEALKIRTGIDLEHIPYRGTPEALADLLSGRVAAMIALPGQMQAHLREGTLVPLMQTGEQRIPILPKVPTAAEAGLAGIVGSGWMGLFAPRGTPEPIIARLAEAARETAREARVSETLAMQGYAAGGMTPDEMAAFVRAESTYWGEIIRQLGLKMD